MAHRPLPIVGARSGLSDANPSRRLSSAPVRRLQGRWLLGCWLSLWCTNTVAASPPPAPSHPSTRTHRTTTFESTDARPDTNTSQLSEAPATPSKGPTALVTGMGVSVSSLAVASLLLTTNHNLRVKHAGLGVLHTGMVLAPLMSHAVVDEWARGAYFSIVPLMGGIGMATLLAISPISPVRSRNGNHHVYPIPIAVSIFGGALGVLDATLVDTRRSGWTAAAGFSHNSAQAQLGTTW